MDEEIKQAIETDNIEQARSLLKKALNNRPTADTYYYASRVALNSQQREQFLRKALELDPWNEKAAGEWENLFSKELAPVSAFAPVGEIFSPDDLATASAGTQTIAPTIVTAVVNKKGVPVWVWLVAGLVVLLVVGVVTGVIVSVNANNQNVAATATASVPTPTPKPVVLAPAVACLPEITDKNYSVSDPMMQVCVTPKNPGQNSDLTVYARILQKGKPISGLNVNAYFNYRFFPEKKYGVTDSDGIARIKANTGPVTVDYPVRVDITFFNSSSKIDYKPKADENIFTPK
jgi:hypothetical protein